jgi:hypothetical protein
MEFSVLNTNEGVPYYLGEKEIHIHPKEDHQNAGRAILHHSNFADSSIGYDFITCLGQ